MQPIRATLVTAIPSAEPRMVRGRERGLSVPLVLGASLAAHVGLAAVLAALPAVGRLAGVPEDMLVAIDFFEAPPAPAPVPEPLPAVEPEPAPVEAIRERRVERAVVPEPEPTPPEITPEPPVAAAVPPSVDDVFGEPPPPMDSLTAAAGAGAFEVPAGEAGGVPGGRAGGTAGGTVGAGGTGGGAVASADDDAGARRRARDAYKRELERFLREHMSYPRAAAREHIEGRVELALRIGDDGSLLGVRVSSSSGFDLLDREAIATARDAGHMPAPPEPCGLRPSDELRVGMVYRLR